MTAIVIASAITYGSMLTLINTCDVLACVSSFVVRSALTHPSNDVGFLRELTSVSLLSADLRALVALWCSLPVI